MIPNTDRSCSYGGECVAAFVGMRLKDGGNEGRLRGGDKSGEAQQDHAMGEPTLPVHELTKVLVTRE